MEESKKTKIIDEIESEEEEKKIEMFFTLLRNYQLLKKQKREDFSENSTDLTPIPRKKLNSGEKSGVVVPAFQPEDFSHCWLDLKPSISAADEIKKVKKEAEEEEEEESLDLKLAL